MLGVLAAVAALVDFGMHRVAVHALRGVVEDTRLLELAALGALPRNLAAVAGLVALFAALGTYLQMPGFARLHLRLPLAVVSGLFTPVVTLATFLPRERIPSYLVLFGMFSGLLFTALFSIAGLAYRTSRPLAAALALSLSCSLAQLLFLLSSAFRAVFAGDAGPALVETPDAVGWLRVVAAVLLGPLGLTVALPRRLRALCAAAFVLPALALLAVLALGGTTQLGPVMRRAGEVSWWLVPLAALPAILGRRPPSSTRERVALGGGALTVLLVLALGVLGELHLHPHYGAVLYGAFRGRLLPEWASLGYVVPAAVTLGGALLGLLHPDPSRRQLGAALLFWLAGGYAPQSPIQLLDAVLAVILLTRAAQSVDPVGRERAALGWRASAPPEDVRADQVP